MAYELFHWPAIQGRGEFVRLALEEAQAPYVDVARRRGGEARMLRIMADTKATTPPFAPPFLKSGRQVIAQVANILLFLGDRHGMAPRDAAGRAWAHQLQLTVTDFVLEVHNTHHPISNALWYRDQKPEAKKYAASFLKHRAPKYLRYFERVLAQNKAGDRYMIGRRLTYPDLSMFQLVEGMRYAFPRGMAKLETTLPRLVALHDRVAERPNVAAYLASKRRIPFNEDGIFRRYPELDAGR